MLEIIIEGWRTGGEERKEAANAPGWQLLNLTEEQKAVAKRMGISEEEYKRTVYAGRLSKERLIEKTKPFARFLESKLPRIAPSAHIDKIRLLTIKREYRVEIYVAGEKKVIFRVAEDMVDDFMEKGFANVGESIERNLETAIAAQVTQAV
jgi:hypothetical protein